MVSTRARRIEAATAFAVIGLVVTVIAALAVLRQRERRVEEGSTTAPNSCSTPSKTPSTTPSPT
jgi:hypothetical protein